MKKIILYIALCISTLAPLSGAGAIMSAGSIAIPLEEIIKNTHLDIISQAPEYVPDEEIRGYSNTVALLLNGLAQTCLHVGNAIGAASANPLAQGVLSTVGASLATAAAVIIDRKQQRDQKKVDHANLSKALSFLFAQLELAEQTSNTRMPNTDLFSVLKAIKSSCNKEAFIGVLLNDDMLASKFIEDLASTADNYCNAHQNALIDAIKIRAGIVFVDWLMQQPVSVEEKTIKLTQACKNGLIVYSPSDHGEEIPALIEQVASTVTKQLLAIYGNLFNVAA